jgi:single-strand DNA-binding protein
MAGETMVTLTGRLVEDMNLRFTPSGQAVASFRIATNPRYFDKSTNEWKDGDALFLTCSVWRRQAENMAESGLAKGDRVIVYGVLKQRSYETKEGEKRTVYEVDVHEVGPSLLFAIAKPQKVTRAATQPGVGEPTQPAAPGPWDQPVPAGAASSDPPF